MIPPVAATPPDAAGSNPGRTLHIERHGDGPPLVLLHGWAMHGGMFASLLPRLARRFSVHLVDLPGHGRSRDGALPLALEPVVAAIAAQVPRATWCGWSLGGLFALHAAATRPQAVDRVVMLCASPRFVRGDDWRHGMSPEIFRDFAAGLRSDYRGTLDRFLALEAFGSDDARGELRALRAELFARGEPAAHVLADGLALLETTDLRAMLPRLAVPALWIAGRRDRLVDPRAMRAAAALAPMSTFAQIEHGGHAPFLTHADEVAALVRSFAQRHSFGEGMTAARSLPSSSSRRKPGSIFPEIETPGSDLRQDDEAGVEGASPEPGRRSDDEAMP